jgi:biotin carboxyl carrier protein
MVDKEGGFPPMKYIAEVDAMEFPIDILDEHHIRYGNDILEVDFNKVNGQPLYSLLVNGESFEGYVYPDEQTWQVLMLGHSYQVKIEDAREKRLKMAESVGTGIEKEYVLKSPMPGLIISVPVLEDQKVDKNQILIILESMKMQNELRSPSNGIVSRVRIKTGDQVQQKQVILTIVRDDL